MLLRMQKNEKKFCTCNIVGDFCVGFGGFNRQKRFFTIGCMLIALILEVSIEIRAWKKGITLQTLVHRITLWDSIFLAGYVSVILLILFLCKPVSIAVFFVLAVTLMAIPMLRAIHKSE